MNTLTQILIAALLLGLLATAFLEREDERETTTAQEERCYETTLTHYFDPMLKQVRMMPNTRQVPCPETTQEITSDE